MQQYLRRAFAAQQALRPDGVRAGLGQGREQAGRRRASTAPSISWPASWKRTACRPRPRPSQIFLGLQVQCTQCHNHPFNDWKQNQFWELNAFFRQTRALRRSRAAATCESVELVNQDFAGERQRARTKPCCSTNCATACRRPPIPCSSTARSSERQRLCRRRRPPRGAGQADRRAREYLRQGDRQSHVGALPGLWLHQADRRHGPAQSAQRIRSCSKRWPRNSQTTSFDLKELIRWIVLSEPYGLSSKIDAAQQARTIRRWARSRCSATSTCGRCGPKSCTNRCSSPPKPTRPRGSYEAAGSDQARVAGAVHARLRHRRKRRNHDLQRHDSAGADDDERRPGQARPPASRRAASCIAWPAMPS